MLRLGNNQLFRAITRGDVNESVNLVLDFFIFSDTTARRGDAMRRKPGTLRYV